MSMLVVTKGPVAIAGSILSLLKRRGISVPTKVEMIIDDKMLSATINPKYGVVLTNFKVAKIPSSNPYKTPRMSPTLISFKMIFRILPMSTRPVAKPRTIIVDDWVPILPPIPMITGINAARAMVVSSMF